MSTLRAVVLAALCLACSTSCALALDDNASDTLRAATPDLRVTAQEQAKLYLAPDLPAFSLLGLNPTDIKRPSSPKGLAIALANSVDSTGHVVQGFAMEFAPGFLFSPFRGDLDRYQQHAMTRILANLRASVGSARASGDSASTDVAFGISTNLQDDGDPMRDKTYTSMLGNILSQQFSETPVESVDASGHIRIPEGVRSQVRTLRENYVKAHWNARRTAFAAVTGLRFLHSDFSDSHGIGLSTWLVHGEPLAKWGQLLLHGQYDLRSPTVRGQRSQEVTYGLRANMGGMDTNGYLELAGTSDIEHGNHPHGRWSGGVEFRLSEGLWISTGLGVGIGPQESRSNVLYVGNLRWALAPGPNLAPQ